MPVGIVTRSRSASREVAIVGVIEEVEGFHCDDGVITLLNLERLAGGGNPRGCKASHEEHRAE